MSTLATPPAAPATPAANPPRARPGKYLTFTLGREVYGVEVVRVREIIGLQAITAVPQTPPFVRGVINLRGKIIPIIDLRLKFRMPEEEFTRNTCIVTVEVAASSGTGRILLGMLVDGVNEVADVGAGDIDAVPSFGFQVNTAYLLGLARSKHGVRLLMDVEKVLCQEELLAAENAAGSTDAANASAGSYVPGALKDAPGIRIIGTADAGGDASGAAGDGSSA